MPQSERRSEAIWVESRARWQINVQKAGKRKTFTSTLVGKYCVSEITNPYKGLTSMFM